MIFSRIFFDIIPICDLAGFIKARRYQKIEEVFADAYVWRAPASHISAHMSSQRQSIVSGWTYELKCSWHADVLGMQHDMIIPPDAAAGNCFQLIYC